MPGRQRCGRGAWRCQTVAERRPSIASAITRPMTKVVAPVEGPDDAWFWDGVRAHRLLLRTCGACGRRQHPPTPLCPACGAADWTTERASGRAHVYSWILSHHPTQPDAEPRIVALVELDEGVRMV